MKFQELLGCWMVTGNYWVCTWLNHPATIFPRYKPFYLEDISSVTILLLYHFGNNLIMPLQNVQSWTFEKASYYWWFSIKIISSSIEIIKRSLHTRSFSWVYFQNHRPPVHGRRHQHLRRRDHRVLQKNSEFWLPGTNVINYLSHNRALPNCGQILI